MDKEIKQNILKAFKNDARIDTEDVDVIVKNHNVLLNGNVETYNAKRAAEDLAGLIRGVKNIENKLNVVLPNSKAKIPKDEIIENVKKSFIWNENLTENNLDVHFEQDTLVLTGYVDKFWKTIKAEEIAKSHASVNKTRNDIIVDNSAPLARSDVQNHILNAIKQRFMIDTNGLKISLKNGKVKIQGAVPSWAIKKSIYELVLYTSGITGIIDDITVAGE